MNLMLLKAISSACKNYSSKLFMGTNIEPKTDADIYALQLPAGLRYRIICVDQETYLICDGVKVLWVNNGIWGKTHPDVKALIPAATELWKLSKGHCNCFYVVLSKQQQVICYDVLTIDPYTLRFLLRENKNDVQHIVDRAVTWRKTGQQVFQKPQDTIAWFENNQPENVSYAVYDIKKWGALPRTVSSAIDTLKKTFKFTDTMLLKTNKQFFYYVSSDRQLVARVNGEHYFQAGIIKICISDEKE